MNRKAVIAIVVIAVLALIVLTAVFGQGLLQMGMRAHGLR